MRNPVRNLSKHGRENFPGLAGFYFRRIPGFASKRERVLVGYAILRKPPLLQKYPVAPRHGDLANSVQAYLRNREGKIVEVMGEGLPQYWRLMSR